MFGEVPYTAPKAPYPKLYHMEDRDSGQGQDAQLTTSFIPHHPREGVPWGSRCA